MMESGELVVRYRARRTYSRRTTEATCEFLTLPPPTCSEQLHFKYLRPVVPAAVGDVPLCMQQPASDWVDGKKRKTEIERQLCISKQSHLAE